jgi:hypothetical protein
MRRPLRAAAGSPGRDAFLPSWQLPPGRSHPIPRPPLRVSERADLDPRSFCRKEHDERETAQYILSIGIVSLPSRPCLGRLGDRVEGNPDGFHELDPEPRTAPLIPVCGLVQLRTGRRRER